MNRDKLIASGVAAWTAREEPLGKSENGEDGGLYLQIELGNDYAVLVSVTEEDGPRVAILTYFFHAREPNSDLKLGVSGPPRRQV